jgi:hypothetical protein
MTPATVARGVADGPTVIVTGCVLLKGVSVENTGPDVPEPPNLQTPLLGPTPELSVITVPVVQLPGP